MSFFLYLLYKGNVILEDVVFTKELAMGSAEYFLIQLIGYGYMCMNLSKKPTVY